MNESHPYMNQKSEIGISEMEQLKKDFGIEIPAENVPLPSRGRFYPQGHPWHMKESVNIKAMTAAEEDILLNESYAKTGETIDRLIHSCLVGADKLNLKGENSMNTILLGDRNALMYYVRIVGYGPEYTTQAVCPQCQASKRYTFDLAEREIKEGIVPPLDPNQNMFEYYLEGYKRRVRFRIPIVADEKEASQLMKAAEKSAKKFGRVVESKIITNSLLAQIVSIETSEGVFSSDKAVISKLIRYMPAMDSKKLRKFMKDCEPGIDTTAYFQCDSCSFEGGLEMPMSKEFFWPE